TSRGTRRDSPMPDNISLQEEFDRKRREANEPPADGKRPNQTANNFPDEVRIELEQPKACDGLVCESKAAGDCPPLAPAKDSATLDGTAPDPAPNPRDTTDIGNARRFAIRHSRRIRYVDEWKRWLIYDGKRWAVDTTREVERLAKQTAEVMLREAFEFDGDDKERMERIKRAVAIKSRYKIAAMIELAKSECAARPEDFDSEPFLVNVQNGTLDLRTG